jgi:hypothetical protein
LRYTQNQRRLELHTKKRRKYMERAKTATFMLLPSLGLSAAELALLRNANINPLVAQGGQACSVKQAEAVLSVLCNHKAVSVLPYVRSMKLRYAIVLALSTSFYNQRRWRKARFEASSDKQRTEATFVNRFRQKFGGPSQTIVGVGDWNQRQQMPFKEPTMGIGLRRLLRRANYWVFLVDERKTSCRCFKCKDLAPPLQRCVKYLTVRNPRPWRRDVEPTILRHGLLRCEGCHTHWDRDLNGALNILQIMKQQIAGNGRPSYLT